MRWIRVAASLSAIALLAGTWVSHLEQTAQLPSVLMSDVIRNWTSSRTMAGLPLEFVLALWFLIAATRYGADEWQSMDFLDFWSGIVVFGVSVGLLYLVGLRCLPIAIGSIVALAIVISSGIRLRNRPAPPAQAVSAALRHDWTLMTGPQGRQRHVTVAAVVVLVGQYLVLSAGATTPADRDAELVRWFESEPRVVSADLVAPDKLRVVAFTDYLCPACSFQIPALEKTVKRYQMGGYEEIELVLRDFPLNSDCNPSIVSRNHPLACRAAVAARVAQRFLTASKSHTFRDRLYAHHGRLTESDLIRELASVRLSERFNETYDRELILISDDVRVATALGISGTPTVFVDGRLLRDVQPRTLAAILSHAVRQTRVSSRVEITTERRDECRSPQRESAPGS